jgi:putative transposase
MRKSTMNYDPQKHTFDRAPQKITGTSQDRHRRSIRLPDYDYSQPGAYFITMVTYRRDFLFGEIVDGEMRLSPMGHIASEHWRAIPEHFPHVELGAYVVMPNHVHGIIMINGRSDAGASERRGTTMSCPNPREGFGKPVKGSIPTIIRSYKASVTNRIQKEFNAAAIWQRNYGACPECPSGRIEGNTSSGTVQNTIGCISISSPT